MNQNEVVEILKQANVLLEGHFLLTSGKHSNKYLQCAKIFKNTKYSEPLCRELAEKFKDDGVEVVIGPALGAIQMAYEVSKHLGCENFFAEREDGKMTLRRGFEIKPQTKVLIVENVITTGGSVDEVIEIVKQAGGILIGVGVVVDRTRGNKDFGVPLHSIIAVDVEAWEPEDCPLCKAGDTNLVKPGSRKI